MSRRNRACDKNYYKNLLLNSLLDAMSDERLAIVRYRDMMHMNTDPEIIRQVKFAYDNKSKHYEMFQHIYYQLTKRRIDLPVPELSKRYSTFTEAVQDSIERETETLELCREIYIMLDNRYMRDTLFEIIQDNQTDFSRLIYICTLLH